MDHKVEDLDHLGLETEVLLLGLDRHIFSRLPFSGRNCLYGTFALPHTHVMLIMCPLALRMYPGFWRLATCMSAIPRTASSSRNSARSRRRTGCCWRATWPNCTQTSNGVFVR